MRRVEGSNALGKKIRELRKAKGISLAELAGQIDASATHLSQIETGKVTNAGVEILGRIATALNADLSVRKHEGAERSLVYGSPFTLDELQQMGPFESEALQKIKKVLEDPKLSLKRRKKIAETLVSMAEWMKSQKPD